MVEPSLRVNPLSLLDLTLLNDRASDEELALLEEKARTEQVAAICVLPKHLQKISPLIKCKRATVVNFPSGSEPINSTLLAIDDAVLHYQANEIDYVFPYQIYLAGQTREALDQYQQVYTKCQQSNTTLKVILETGAFPSSDAIYQLSLQIINLGCDFLKTSTGKIPLGATPMAATSILKAIKESGTSCGIKVSGGIKTTHQAFLYMQLAQDILNRDLDNTWFRIGASTLFDELLQEITKNNSKP